MTIYPHFNSSDASNFEKISDNNINELLSYSTNISKLYLESASRLETKASAEIPIVLTLFAGYYLWIKDYLKYNMYLLYLFYLNIILLSIAILLCFICILVRRIPYPPSISGILEWLKDKDIKTINKSLYASILFNILLFEQNINITILNKANILRISQIVVLAFILLVFISSIISIH